MVPLLERLSALRGDDSSLRNGFTNHLPMALAALSALGANAAVLDRFSALYRAQVQPMPPETAPLGEPDAALGNGKAYPAWLAYFDALIASEGQDAVLRLWLPRLVDGLVTAAFHGLIRLAYGVRFACAGEVAGGLAMLAAYRVVGPLPAGEGTTGVAEGLRMLAQGPAFAEIRFDQPMIMRRLIEVMQHPTFPAATPPLRIEKGAERAWISLAVGAARLYRATADFSVLHLVTSLHALKVLWPWLGEPESVLQRFWAAFCAVFVAIGRPWPMEYLDSGALRAWAALAAAACESQDDHLIKLVDSCNALATLPDLADSELAMQLQHCANLVVSRGHA